MLKPKCFEVDDFKNWKSHLDEKGFVVLEKILSIEERGKGLNIFNKDMKIVSSNFDLERKETFKIENTPMMFSKGMVVFNGFGNSDFMWHVRLCPKIIKIYELLYNTENLKVSLDGFSLFVSSEQKSKSWLHTDQNPENKIYSVQGAYNFLPVEENSAGFVVVPNSHKTYNPKIKGKGDWVIFEKNKQGFENLEKESVKLLIPENCFVLWNSRTLHANTGMNKKRGEKIFRFDRLTCYITFLPSDFVPDKEKEALFRKRKEAYLKCETTSHWANKCEIKKYPYGFGKTYESRNFNKLKSTLDENNEIPKDRLKYI